MLNKLRNYLFVERPYGVKILMALSSLTISIILTTKDGSNTAIAKDMENLARLELWFVFFISYAFLLLYGVFWHNLSARMIGSIYGTFMWNGLFVYHMTASADIEPIHGIYFVFGLFSIWNIAIVYEHIRIRHKYGIDLNKMATEMMMQFLEKYRK